LSVTHYNNELGEVVEYEMLDPQCLAEMTPLVILYQLYQYITAIKEPEARESIETIQRLMLKTAVYIIVLKATDQKLKNY